MAKAVFDSSANVSPKGIGEQRNGEGGEGRERRVEERGGLKERRRIESGEPRGVTAAPTRCRDSGGAAHQRAENSEGQLHPRALVGSAPVGKLGCLGSNAPRLHLYREYYTNPFDGDLANQILGNTGTSTIEHMGASNIGSVRLNRRDHISSAACNALTCHGLQSCWKKTLFKIIRPLVSVHSCRFSRGP